MLKKYSPILFALLFLGTWQGMAAAACWELTDKDGRKILATDIWHIKNRLDQGGFLMGRLDGEDVSIPVADIKTLTLAPVKKGWIPFMGGHTMNGEVVFINGRKGQFESDLNLHLLKDARKSSMPLADVRSIVRCDAETSAMLTGGKQEGTTGTVPTKQQPVVVNIDSVHLTNGDVLYGTITTTEFNWKAPYASLMFKREQIQTITLRSNGKESGLLELRTGDRISGDLEDKVIEITLKYGQRIPIATEMLKSARFRTTAP